MTNHTSSSGRENRQCWWKHATMEGGFKTCSHFTAYGGSAWVRTEQDVTPAPSRWRGKDTEWTHNDMLPRTRVNTTQWHNLCVLARSAVLPCGFWASVPHLKPSLTSTMFWMNGSIGRWMEGWIRVGWVDKWILDVWMDKTSWEKHVFTCLFPAILSLCITVHTSTWL